MNDSDKLKDIASDPPSQNKFQNKKLHIEKILQKRVAHTQSKNDELRLPAEKAVRSGVSDAEKEAAEDAPPDNIALLAGRRTSSRLGESTSSRLGESSEQDAGPNATSPRRTEGNLELSGSSVSKIKQIQILSQHALVGACILFLILFTLPTFLNTINWLTEKTKPLAITVTWFVVMLIANIIFVVSKK